jgi:hypothetical protein
MPGPSSGTGNKGRMVSVGVLLIKQLFLKVAAGKHVKRMNYLTMIKEVVN